MKSFRNIAMTLSIGALGSHSGYAGAQDLVAVTVEVAPGTTSNTKKCSDPQTGDAAKNQYVICADPETRKTNPHGPHNDVSVQWNLTDTTTGNSWAFPVVNGGIDIKDKNNWTVTPNSANQYTANNQGEGGNKKYRYTINVLSGSYLLTWDPTIMN